MRIEELILEGFKSYPVRTTINGWDPSFNAITGLNGSGKSNILDAICFVLGITNMQTMRASNQQDLIYKRGQAGVTKASVTIVFDNADRSKSPPGLEHCKQITVTRQVAIPNMTKYLLNGHKSTQQHIQSVFQSVQLNINNPNFVIMQGKITKVLNMKPQEILSMIEEAAGTRMFEDRKDKAQRTMAKKDRKVSELNATLDEEIAPKLDKLEKDNENYQLFKKSKKDLEKIGLKLRSFEYVDARERSRKKEAEVEAKKAEIKEIQANIEAIKKEIKSAEKEQKDVLTRREAEQAKGGKISKLEKDVGELAKDVRKMAAQVDLKQKDVKEEEGRIGKLQEELRELNNNLKNKETQIEQLKIEHAQVDSEHKTLAEKLEANEELLSTLLTGLGSNANNGAGGGGGYMGALASAEKRGAEAAADEKQARVKMTMHEKELKETESRYHAVEREAKDGKGKVEKIMSEVGVLEKQLEKTGWSEELNSQLEGNLRTARQQVKELTTKRDGLKHHVSSTDFIFTPPSGMNPSNVKGRVVRLLQIKSEHYDKALALEIAAGGKLYNVIVSDDQTATRVLDEGKMPKRATLIPLNKIYPHILTPDKLSKAKIAAKGGEFNSALDLVTAEPDIAKGIQYVFSDTLVCKDQATARSIRDSAGIKTVTVEGDIYDSGGNLTGGAPPPSNGILLKVQDLIKVEVELRGAESKLAQLERQSKQTEKQRSDWKSLHEKLDMKKHELKLLEAQIGGSSASRIGEQVAQLKLKIQSLDSEIKSAHEKQNESKKEAEKLKQDMNDFKNNKEGKIAELKKAIATQKQSLQKHSVKVKTQQKDTQTASMEKDQIEQEIEAGQNDIKQAQASIVKLNKESKKLSEEYEETQARYKAAEQELKDERATLDRYDGELKALEQTINQKGEDKTQAEVEIEEKKRSLEALHNEKKHQDHVMSDLSKKYEYIRVNLDILGKAGTDYDFGDAENVSKLRKEAEKLEGIQKGMKKKLNPKAESMIENLAKRRDELLLKLDSLDLDKKKIDDTIGQLDAYKREALERTWKKVDEDFGGIFGELLPGNFAKLQPPEDQDLMDGLEVKVRLGSVWKQSLTELSGGQRSLIALSLIMALLQFKPAPMYILDEIDAALDLSHTQHIGQLFRTRFKGSQFIVVSLKEGLFSNANVLFRAKFRDGTSIVERIASRSSSNLYKS